MTGHYVLAASALNLAACASAPPIQVIDAGERCAVHNPNPRRGETIPWSGNCRSGFAHGPGVLEWFLDGAPNGRFEGSLNGGRIDGEGTADYPSGYQYIGNFRDGRPDGRGTFILADGHRLTGF